MRVFAVVLSLGVLFCAAQAQETEKKITRAQLPPEVEKTVARESEGATIKEFASETEHGKQSYEALLIVNGHPKDILMEPRGKIVEVEEQVRMDSLPTGVQDALKKTAGSGTITMIESLTKNGQLVAYEAHVKHGR